MNVNSVKFAAPRADDTFGTSRSVAIWISWHILCAICIPLAVGAIRLQMALWEMSQAARLYLGSFAVAHILGAIALSALVIRRGRVGFVAVGAAVGTAYAVLF